MARIAPRMLAISSGGGHWVQLNRLLPAFESHEVVLATVNPAYRADAGGRRFHVLPDATRWNRLGLLRLGLRILWLLIRERPQVVVTTGAAPGYIALRLAKLLGARTVWIDSIANVEELSLSGRMAGKCADLWLTQWPELARPGGPSFAGSVL